MKNLEIIDIIMKMFEEQEGNITYWSCDIIMEEYLKAAGLDCVRMQQSGIRSGCRNFSHLEGDTIYCSFGGENLDKFKRLNLDGDCGINSYYKNDLFERFSREQISEEDFLKNLLRAFFYLGSSYYELNLIRYINSRPDFKERLINIKGNTPEIINLRCVLYELGILEDKVEIYGTSLSKYNQFRIIAFGGYDRFRECKTEIDFYNAIREVEHELFYKNIINRAVSTKDMLMTDIGTVGLKQETKQLTQLEFNENTYNFFKINAIDFEFLEEENEVDRLLLLVLLGRFIDSQNSPVHYAGGYTEQFIKKYIYNKEGYKNVIANTNLITYSERDVHNIQNCRCEWFVEI